jgi:hypothetical protein
MNFKNIRIVIYFVGTILLFALVLSSIADVFFNMYGPLKWAKDNHEFAPWFSGIATSTGVLVALYNGDRQMRHALEKSAQDDQKAAQKAAEADLAFKNAAVGVMMLVDLFFDTLDESFTRDPKIVFFAKDSVVMSMETPLRMMKQIPIYQLPIPNAVTAWMKIEVNLSNIANLINIGFEELNQKKFDDKSFVNTKESLKGAISQVNEIIDEFYTEVDHLRTRWTRIEDEVEFEGGDDEE